MTSTASSLLAFRRTFHIIRALQRAAASRSELQVLVVQIEGEDAYNSASSRARQKAFEEDIRRAREQFGIDIYYNRTRQKYEIAGVSEQGWFNVPDSVLDVMAFLYKTFGDDAPRASEVRIALDTLISYLPEQRRDHVQAQRPALSIELREMDRPIEPRVMQEVQRAVGERRILRFFYLSPHYNDQRPRLHQVEQMRFTSLQGEWEGWVEVTAETNNLFPAAQTLLRYADKCVVLEPPE